MKQSHLVHVIRPHLSNLTKMEKPIPESHGSGKKYPRQLKVGNWSTKSLNLALQAVDESHNISRVVKHYNIPRTALRDHVNGKI